VEAQIQKSSLVYVPRFGGRPLRVQDRLDFPQLGLGDPRSSQSGRKRLQTFLALRDERIISDVQPRDSTSHARDLFDQVLVRKDKQQNDQLFLRIGDPNHPKYDSLYLKYDKSKNKNQWQIVVYDDKKKQWSVPKDYQTAGYNDVAVHGRAEGDKWEFEPLRGPDNYRKILELAQDGNKNIGDIAKATNLQLDAVPAPPSKAVTRPPSKPETDFEAKKEALKAEMRAHVQRYKMKQGEDIPAEDIEKERKWVKDWNAKGRDLARRWKELTGKEEMSDQDLRDVGLK